MTINYKMGCTVSRSNECTKLHVHNEINKTTSMQPHNVQVWRKQHCGSDYGRWLMLQM